MGKPITLLTPKILDDFFNSRIAFNVLNKKDLPMLLNIISKNKNGGVKNLMYYEQFSDGIAYQNGQLCHAPIDFYRKRGFEIVRVYEPKYVNSSEVSNCQMTVCESYVFSGSDEFSIIERDLLLAEEKMIFYSKNHAFKIIEKDGENFLELWEQNDDGCLARTQTIIHEKEIDNIMYCLEVCKENIKK